MIRRSSGEPRTRTLRSALLRVLVPRVALFVTTSLIVVLGHAAAVDTSARPLPGPSDHPSQHYPSWRPEYAAQYPGCMPTYAWPHGQLAAALVVYSFRDHARRKVAFDAAWRVNHDQTEVDDVWVLGVCR